jgi:ubiquinone biosynthesis protein COQ9
MNYGNMQSIHLFVVKKYKICVDFALGYSPYYDFNNNLIVAIENKLPFS